MSDLIHDVTLYEDIPEKEGRLPREMEVYYLLKKLEIPKKCKKLETELLVMVMIVS